MDREIWIIYIAVNIFYFRMLVSHGSRSSCVGTGVFRRTAHTDGHQGISPIARLAVTVVFA